MKGAIIIKVYPEVRDVISLLSYYFMSESILSIDVLFLKVLLFYKNLNITLPLYSKIDIGRCRNSSSLVLQNILSQTML